MSLSKIKFSCWKCGTELCVVHGEYFALSAWVTCPNEECKAPNGLTYKFPEARYELE